MLARWNGSASWQIQMHFTSWPEGNAAKSTSWPSVADHWSCFQQRFLILTCNAARGMEIWIELIYNHFFPRVGPYFGFYFAQTVSCAAFRLEGLLDVLTKFYLVLPEEDFRLLLCLKAEPALCCVSKFSKQIKVALFDSFCLMVFLSVVAKIPAGKCW